MSQDPLDPKDFVRRQLFRYRDLLANFTRRNKELYFRPGVGSSLNLSIEPVFMAPSSVRGRGGLVGDEAPSPLDSSPAAEVREAGIGEQRGGDGDLSDSVGSTVSDVLAAASSGGGGCDENEGTPVFEPMGLGSEKLARLFRDGTLDLTAHLLLKERPSKPLEARLEKIRAADSRYQKEFGISGAWLLGPFLLWRGGATHAQEDLFISPILKLPVDVLLSGKKRWELRVEDQSLCANPSLQLALLKKLGVTLPDQFDCDSPEDAIRILAEALAGEGRKVEILNGPGAPRQLPAILPKARPEKDEDGNVVSRRPTSVDRDLSHEDQALYRRVTIQNFVILDVFYVDHINATRLPLFMDYDEVIEAADEHSIVAELLGGVPASSQDEKARQPRELDRYSERENFFVVPTDSTQHAVIERASRESAIVVQGPPGTGKSQTITNLIADKIARGQKVLFVAEKRAALDVVFTRLRQAGIDKQAVLIHSSEMNRNDLYRSFLELAEAKPDETDEHAWGTVAASLDGAKAEVHDYFDAIGAPYAHTGLVVADVLALYASVLDLAHEENVSLGLAFAKNVSGHEIDELESLLDQIEEQVARVEGFAAHPWRQKKNGLTITAVFRGEFREIVGEAEKLVLALRQDRLEAEKLFPGLDLWRMTSARISALTDACGKEAGAGAAFGDVWEDGDVRTAILARAGDHGGLAFIKEKRDAIEARLRELEAMAGESALFRPDADQGLVDEMTAYLKVPRGVLAFMQPSYWRARRIIRSLLVGDETAKRRVDVRSMTERPLVQFTAFRKAHAELADTMRTLGDLEPPPLVSGVPHIRERALALAAAAQDCGRLLRAAQAILGEEASRAGLGTGRATADFARKAWALFELSQRHSASLDRLYAICSKVDTHFQSPRSWPRPTDDDPEAVEKVSLLLKRLLSTIDACDDIERIEVLSDSVGRRFGVPQMMEAVLPQLLAPGVIDPQASLRQGPPSWGRRVKREILRLWYDDVRSGLSQVRGFDRALFEGKIAAFRQLEERHGKTASDAVNHAFSLRWAAEPKDQRAIGLLRREAVKQRRVMFPREIMEKGALSTMVALKPCWLMSPLSVSQILPMVRGMFDVIVFDEASQVRVEDAIPSIYRAKAMVVVGDPKQMPPTNFFLGGIEDDQEDEVDEEIAESILDLASRVYPTAMLEWHYRSRAESLIAFSNRAFYGGRLIAPPNPAELGADGALRFTQVKDGYFTQKTGNLAEAERVVDEIRRLLTGENPPSLGVIAMGQPQKLALDAALEARMERDLEFAAAVKAAESRKEGDAHVGFFLKNLENVQGDERDVILLSVGYASSRPGKKLILNFGPLSKAGGARRLNVAITRARLGINVFCSFNPDELKTDEAAFAANPNSTTFGRYLKYARALGRGLPDEAKAILDSFGVAGVITRRKASRFSRDVARRLSERGYEVSLEVGSSGFFVDIAVHHPSIPGNYVLGVECDGALFHSLPYARDRDKARDALLTRRGWRMLRVWGPEWSRSRESELSRIEAAIREALGDPC